MKMELSTTRRTFIKGAAIFGGLSLLTGIGAKSPAAGKQTPPDSQPMKSEGYRLTEHVKKYYETARS
jgi:hypothetical protein